MCLGGKAPLQPNFSNVRNDTYGAVAKILCHPEETFAAPSAPTCSNAYSSPDQAKMGAQKQQRRAESACSPAKFEPDPSKNGPKEKRPHAWYNSRSYRDRSVDREVILDICSRRQWRNCCEANQQLRGNFNKNILRLPPFRSRVSPCIVESLYT